MMVLNVTKLSLCKYYSSLEFEMKKKCYHDFASIPGIILFRVCTFTLAWFLNVNRMRDSPSFYQL